MTASTRRVLAGLLGVVGLLALLYVADVAIASGRVPRGTVVAGVEIGGRSRTEALRLIAARVTAPDTVTVNLPAGERPLKLDAARVGLRIDPDRTLDAARSEALNPFTRVRAMFATNAVEPAASVDDAKLRAAVRAWAKKVDRSKREGYVRFDGATPVAVLPKAGLRMDVEQTAAAIVAAYPARDATDAVVAVDPTTTTPESVAAALENVAEPAVSAPMTLVAGGGKQVALRPDDIAKFLRLRPDAQGVIAPKLDRTAFDEVVDPLLRPLERAAKDAPVSIDESTGKLTIGKSEKGTAVDRDALFTELLPALTDTGSRTVPLTIEQVEPRLSPAKAKTLGI